MGTHYHDQPPEQWADAVSLDPTPVWKQYVVVAGLLALSLVLIALVAVPAILPTVVSPPALVPGGRVVLALARMPPVAGEPMRFGPALVDDEHAFYIAQPAKGELVAVRARWSVDDRGAPCAVATLAASTAPTWRYAARCPGSADEPTFGPRGEPLTAPRSLARYLVSVDRDRVIVNISREIREYGATPQPRVSPLPPP